MCRSHGVGLCYSPMLLASQLVRDASYRRRYLEDDLVVLGDRPLVVQLGGSDVETMVESALLIEATGLVDAVDVNLGCPQSTAR
jgi:tRNA-dihydrouridine synthase 1